MAIFICKSWNLGHSLKGRILDLHSSGRSSILLVSNRILNILKSMATEINKIIKYFVCLLINNPYKKMPFQIDLTFVVFFIMLIGVWAFIGVRTNFITMMIAIEMCIFSVSLLWLQASLLLDDSGGQVVSFVLLTVAAVESAIGLSLLVAYYRKTGSITVIEFSKIKG